MKRNLFLIAIIAIFSFGTANAQLFSDDFQDNDMSDWLTVSPDYASAPYNWHLSTYNDDYYLSASAYDNDTKETYNSTQWVVSPAFDASGQSSVSVTFDNRIRYGAYQDIEVYVSTDFAGDSASFEAATWVQVTGYTVDADDSDYDWETATTGTASITGTAATYIAFKYVSKDNTGGNWVINNVSVAGSTAVNELEAGMKVYPNPVSAQLTVTAMDNIASVELINVIGQNVRALNNVNATSAQISTEGLNNGVYFIRISDINGNVATSKILKK